MLFRREFLRSIRRRLGKMERFTLARRMDRSMQSARMGSNGGAIIREADWPGLPRLELMGQSMFTAGSIGGWLRCCRMERLIGPIALRAARFRDRQSAWTALSMWPAPTR